MHPWEASMITAEPRGLGVLRYHQQHRWLFALVLSLLACNSTILASLLIPTIRSVEYTQHVLASEGLEMMFTSGMEFDIS